jgi:hypothetical protein
MQLVNMQLREKYLICVWKDSVLQVAVLYCCHIKVCSMPMTFGRQPRKNLTKKVH